jgi:hypothetical protein
LLAAAACATLGAGLLSRAKPVATAAAAALALVELALQNRSINETADPAVFRRTPAVVEALRRDGRPRIYAWEPAAAAAPRVRAPAGWSRRLAFASARQARLTPPLGSRFGLRGSFDPDIVLVEPAYVRELYGVFRRTEGSPVFVRFLRMAAVDRVISLHDAPGSGLLPDASVPSSSYDEPIRVWRVPDAVPRLSVVGGAKGLDGLAAVKRLLAADFDPAREVVVVGPRQEGSAAVPGHARFVQDRPDRIEVHASLQSPGWLVIADAFDPGWLARVDGRPTPLFRANLAFRAVAVGAGDHIVEMRYWPEGLSAGLALSGASLLLAAALSRRRFT